MTRTARASYPNAINKDRSEAKNGMDKHIPKRGAGPYNWGSLEDELEIETAAFEDEQAELDDEARSPTVKRESQTERPAVERRGSALSAEEIKQGIEFRKKALKSPDTDLASIARTAPALSTSPTHPAPIVANAHTNAVKAL